MQSPASRASRARTSSPGSPAEPDESAELAGGGWHEERFVPPPPPPLPRVSKDRLAAWLGVFVSPVLLLVATVLRIPLPTIVAWLLVAAFLGGFGYLVAQMPRGPRDPFDDGARLSALAVRHGAVPRHARATPAHFPGQGHAATRPVPGRDRAAVRDGRPRERGESRRKVPMPRKVDHASRFHFLREAAFAIVRDRGVGALSRRALADELGTSRNRVDDLLRKEADLRVLAAGEVKNRWTTGRFGLTAGDPSTVPVRLVTSLMPDTPARIDEELVWLRLLVEGPRAHSPDEDPDGPLWRRYQIAERGYVYSERPRDATVRDSTVRDSTVELGQPGDRPDPLAGNRADREEVMSLRLVSALEALDLDAARRNTELPRLRALVDGLTLAICLGRLAPDTGVQVIRDHLAAIAPAPAPGG